MSLFTNKSFMFLLTTRIFTNIADSVFYIVTMWYVVNHFHSSFYTGLVVFFITLPEVLLIFFGPIIDRSNPKKILIYSTVFQLFLIFILISLLQFDLMHIWILLMIIFISTSLSAITYPLEETILPQIVDTKHLITANSALSISYKVLDSLFNALSGILITTFTLIHLYEINWILFLFPLLTVCFMKFSYKGQQNSIYSFNEYKTDLIEGYHAISKSILKKLLFPLIIVNFFGAVNAVAYPYYAKTFENAAETYGFILGAIAVGGIIGSFSVNLFQKINIGKILIFGFLIRGIIWCFLPFTNSMIVALLLFVLTSICTGITNIIYSSLIQTLTPISLLGRVNATVDTIITLAMPIGALFGGFILGFLNIYLVISFYGIISILIGIIYFKDKQILNLKLLEPTESNI